MLGLMMALALSAQPGSADEVVAKAFEKPAAPRAASAPGTSLLGWALALGAVGAVAAMALRRRGRKPQRGFAEVAQNLSVGPKRSLLVVSFAGQRLLVGS